MYFLTIRQNTMNIWLLIMERSFIYHKIRSVFLNSVTTHFYRFLKFSSIDLFFLRYFPCILGNWILYEARNIFVWFGLFHDLASLFWRLCYYGNRNENIVHFKRMNLVTWKLIFLFKILWVCFPYNCAHAYEESCYFCLFVSLFISNDWLFLTIFMQLQT